MEEACTLSAGAPPPCLQASSIELFIDAQNPYFQDIQCLLSMYFSMCPVVSSFYYVGNPRSETQANESRNLSLCEVRLLHSRAGELNLMLLENADF